MTPEPQHCDHECVCGVLMVTGIEGDRSPCELTGCKHDTRSRAAPSPADEDTVTMPRWVFEMLTKERKYNPYTARDDEVEVRKIIEPLRCDPSAEPSCQICLSEMATFCQNCPHVNENFRDKAREHDATIRNQTLDDVVKLSEMIETNETERWESIGRPKKDSYINGSHSGYGHALRDMRQWIDAIKKAQSLRSTEAQHHSEVRR